MMTGVIGNSGPAMCRVLRTNEVKMWLCMELRPVTRPRYP